MVLVPMMSWPVMSVSILLVVTSLTLAGAVLMHKGRGGGLSDLFGGGASSSMGGTSVAEKQLDRLTILVSLVWLACIIGLGLMYKFGV